MKPLQPAHTHGTARPSVHLYIERLVLDGVPVTSAQGPAVRAAVEAELQRLLTEHGLAGEFAGGGAFVGTQGPAINTASGIATGTLGSSIGRSVYASLAGGAGEATR